MSDTPACLRCVRDDPVRCMIIPSNGRGFGCSEGGMGRVDLAGAAHLQLVSGVVQLHPEDAMVEAMLGGWRAQQLARGLRETTIAPRERLGRAVLAVTREDPREGGAAPGRKLGPSVGGGGATGPSGIAND